MLPLVCICNQQRDRVFIMSSTALPTTQQSALATPEAARLQFMAGMSHELRTPLNAILGFVQLLQVSPGLNSEQLDYLREIDTAGTGLLTLVNGMLELGSNAGSRINLNREAVTLANLLPGTLALVEPLARARGITLQQGGTPSLLYTDLVRLKQVLLNLLFNAVKYNIEGGEVRLVCLAGRSGRLRLEVQDSGPGIPKTQLASIFEPFGRPDSAPELAAPIGLGLMITRRLVKLMQGELGVCSIVGRGSVFWVELPQRTDEPAASRPAQRVLALGPASPLQDCLRELVALRPALEFRHYTHAAEVPADPGELALVLVEGEAPLAQGLHKQLKLQRTLVVKVCTGQPDQDAAVPGTLLLPANARLPAVLALLDQCCRPATT